jgi:hypothetical protein
MFSRKMRPNSFYECMGVFRELACTGVEVHSSTRTVTCTTVHIYLDNVYLYVLVSCGVQCGDLNPGSKNKFFLCILPQKKAGTGMKIQHIKPTVLVLFGVLGSGNTLQFTVHCSRHHACYDILYIHHEPHTHIYSTYLFLDVPHNIRAKALFINFFLSSL